MADEASPTVELRGQCPREVVDVLDAFCSARRLNRQELVNRILKRWAMERLHEANVLANVTRGNPPLTDSAWGSLE